MGRAYEQHLDTEPMINSSQILVSTVFVLAQLWHTQGTEPTVEHHLAVGLSGLCAQVGSEVLVSGERTKQLFDRSFTVEVRFGAAGGDRTHDPWLRRPILYPLSYSRNPTNSISQEYGSSPKKPR